MPTMPSAFVRYRGEIDAAVKHALAGYTLPLYTMLRYHLGWEDEQGNALSAPAGKALRPTLCLLACEATCGAYGQALPAAAALELVHNFSLIHDDIQDDDRERRHRPTVWSVWGKPQAINAGTAMRALAGLTAMGLEGQGVPIAKQLQVLRLMDESCLRLIEGQYLDISFEHRLDVRVADYVRMIGLKTACLIACAIEIGALLGTDDVRTIQSLRSFGRYLGLAFQVRDDVLGIWGDPALTGKPVGSDILRRKKTLPIVYALGKATGPNRDEMLRIYSREPVSDQDRQRVLDVLAGLGAEAWAQARAEEYGARGVAELAGLNLPPTEQQNLEEMAAFLTQREF